MKPHVAAVERDFAGNGAQQSGFAGAVAPDKADAPARIDREVGAIEQGAAAHTDDDTGNNEQRHGWGVAPEAAE